MYDEISDVRKFYSEYDPDLYNDKEYVRSKKIVRTFDYDFDNDEYIEKEIYN